MVEMERLLYKYCFILFFPHKWIGIDMCYTVRQKKLKTYKYKKLLLSNSWMILFGSNHLLSISSGSLSMIVDYNNEFIISHYPLFQVTKAVLAV